MFWKWVLYYFSILIGLIPSKAIRFLEHMNVASIALSTFHQHQKYYLHPAVSTMWKDFQYNYFDQKTQQGDSLVLGGDGRADTSGHSAKYGSYAMLDMDLMLVIDIQLVQVWFLFKKNVINSLNNFNFQFEIWFFQTTL